MSRRSEAVQNGTPVRREADATWGVANPGYTSSDWAAGGVEPGLRFNTEACRDPVDVVEVGDDLRRIVYGPVLETGSAEPVDVFPTGCLHRARELNRELEESPCWCIEVGGAPVCSEALDQFLVLDLRPEIMQMGLRSVVALVHL